MSMSAKELLAAGSLLLALGAGGVSAARAAAPAAPTLKFTVLYDNYVFKEGTKADWGFSCLIEGAEKTILFDTGTKPGILSYNVAALGVDLKQVDLVVLSHAHEDHTGGLPAVLGVKPGVEVLFPVSFGTAFAGKVAKAGAKPRPVDGPVEICPDVWLTGEMGTAIREMSLVLDTPRGLVVATGCAHPGIVGIIKRAKEIRNRPIHLVLGGFHLMNASADFLRDVLASFDELGVERCGATHCTGDRQIAQIKAHFGARYVPLGTGRVVEVPGSSRRTDQMWSSTTSSSARTWSRLTRRPSSPDAFQTRAY
jgi:7,8-dihydropterin-6-yl-methyl-4-(beta-D-ribofuranosyl)aminobenzene 5'-phosphate synthase